MSSADQFFSTYALDGALFGVVLACGAIRAFQKFMSDSAALLKIRKAPSIHIGDLRSVINSEQSESSGEPLVVVRGTVDVKSVVEGGGWKSPTRSDALLLEETGDKAVIIQSMQTCIYCEWKGFFGWTCDLRALLGKSLNKRESTSLKTVPFILFEGDRWLNVNLVGSRHPLPLTTVYHQFHSNTYTFFQALFGLNEFPVGLLDEKKILPLGEEISAVGICSFNDGVPEIKSCNELPYFLSEKTKDQMVLDLAASTKIRLWSGIVLGLMSIGVLGYAAVRNWNKWKEWRRRRQLQQPRDGAEEDDGVTDDAPLYELCVICWVKRRRYAFTPCGHLVCCEQCATRVKETEKATCPVCIQQIQSSVRIHDS
ncbi:hypothetical protein SLA2020_341280 [Shorea laevis]